MAEPTLLQRARERLDCARALPDVEQSARVIHIGIAVMRILEHLEERHEAARAPQVVPEANAKTSNTTSSACFDALALDALQALCDAATPGPWESSESGDILDEDGELMFTRYLVSGGAKDGAFIEAARDALPKLIAEVRRLRERLPVCAECARDDRDGDTCALCGDEVGHG